MNSVLLLKDWNEWMRKVIFAFIKVNLIQIDMEIFSSTSIFNGYNPLSHRFILAAFKMNHQALGNWTFYLDSISKNMSRLSIWS
jgi:hypothetical protein